MTVKVDASVTPARVTVDGDPIHYDVERGEWVDSVTQGVVEGGIDAEELYEALENTLRSVAKADAQFWRDERMLDAIPEGTEYDEWLCKTNHRPSDDEERRVSENILHPEVTGQLCRTTVRVLFGFYVDRWFDVVFDASPCQIAPGYVVD